MRHRLEAKNATGASWRVAGYARLSKEDGMYGGSESINEQCKIIQSWVAQQEDALLVAQYTDDGYSGATFDRPGFTQMIEDAQQGAFDTIVVKDLSRFGRSYLDCGNWIERTLPELGIRLYSISDRFDSMDSWDFDTALLVPIKNLMNEMLVLTTSEKVRTSLAAKRARGECVANFAPYGYVKDPANKHQLVVDEAAARVVRQIFIWFIDGCSASEIARMLNSAFVPSPATYRQQQGSGYSTQFSGGGGKENHMGKWHAGTVLRILRNETYTGTLVQGKTQRTGWRTHTSAAVEPVNWQRFPHAHEAIVGVEHFQRVTKMLEAAGQRKIVK